VDKVYEFHTVEYWRERPLIKVGDKVESPIIAHGITTEFNGTGTVYSICENDYGVLNYLVKIIVEGEEDEDSP
jgi:hypothetical protein